VRRFKCFGTGIIDVRRGTSKRLTTGIDRNTMDAFEKMFAALAAMISIVK
jgi:hypothetical protein